MIFYVKPSNLKSLFQAGKDMIHQMVKIRLKKSILKDAGGMIQKMTDHHQEGEILHLLNPKPSGKLRRHMPSFGCILAVRPKKYFF